MKVAGWILLGLAAWTFARAGGPEDRALRKEVEATYAKWDSLIAKGDLAGMMTMLDASFVGLDLDGNVATKRDTERFMRQWLQSVREVRSFIRVEEIYPHGNEVEAWITMTLSFKTKKGGKWVEQSVTERFAETLKKTKTGWKFTHSQLLPPF